MRIAINTRLLLKGKMDGIGWFTYETTRRIVTAHPEHTFYLLFALLFDFRRSRQYKNFRPNAVKHYGIKSYLGLFKRGS